MNTKMMVILLIGTLIAAPSMVFGASPWAAETAYSEQIGSKFTFGLTNTMLGWTDIFVEPKQYHNDDKNVWAGVGKGMVDAVANTAGGAFHLVTFMIPQVDVSLPEDGVNIEGRGQVR